MSTPDPGSSAACPDLTRIKNPTQQAEAISQALKLARIDGFCGRCAAVAMAINETLFGGMGTVVAAYNLAMMKRHARFLGHVAVYYRGRYWDSTGEILREDLESWGMLAPDDPDYAEEYGKGWNAELAERAAVREYPDGIAFSAQYQADYEEAKRRLTIILHWSAGKGRTPAPSFD